MIVMLILRRWLNLAIFLGQLLWRIPSLTFYPSAFRQHLYRVGPPLLPSVIGLHALLSLVILHYLSQVLVEPEPLGIAFALTFCQHVPLIVCSGLLAIQLAAASAQELLYYQQNQQLEVLRWMGISAIDYLLFPRLLAGFILFPLLLIFAFSIGLWVATLSAAQQYSDLDLTLFWGGIRSVLSLQVLVMSLIKGSFLGLTIALTGYTWGYTPLEPSAAKESPQSQTQVLINGGTHAALSAWGLAILCNFALSPL